MLYACCVCIGCSGALDVVRTVVPASWQGHGLAGIVVKAAFDYAIAKKLLVVPTCGYIRDTFLKRGGRAELYAGVIKK